MMRTLTLVFLMTSTFFYSQKKKYKMDVVSNIDVKVLALKPFGNNALAKNLEPFYGFGFGGNLMTPINFGIGFDYNLLFSNVKYDQKYLYGNLGSPKMTIVDFYLTHRENISEEFMVEEMAGFSYYNQTDLLIDENVKLKNSGMGFNLGAKAIYVLEGAQQVFLAGKFNYYANNIYNENPEIQKYYNRSYFLNLSLGYRYQF